jgi:pilus assembly protein CpaE
MNHLQQARNPLHLPEVIEKSARLPDGRPMLMAFVAKANDEACLRACLEDLAFGDTQVIRGGIIKAIDYLSVRRTPTILIVDVSDVDMPASRVFELSEVCEPEVTVIAIGDTNDVGLYRDLMQMGINEYIVKPVTAELIAAALPTNPTAGAPPPISQKLGKMVTVLGSRGGVGATTLAVNLAWYLANRQHRRVALVDFDLHNGDCALTLNLKPTPGLREALTNPLRIDNLFLERAMARHGEFLFVLSSEESLHDQVDFTTEATQILLRVLRLHFHYVIADVPSITPSPYRLAVDIASRQVIVADHTLRSVRDTARLRSVLGGTDTMQRTLVVINRSGEGGRHQAPLNEIEKHLGVRPKIVIPFQPTSFASVSLRGRPLAARPGRFAEAIENLAGEISGRPFRRHRWWRWAT